MSKLKIPLSAITDEGYCVDVVVSSDELRPADAKEISLSDVRVTGKITEAGEHYVFHGKASGSFEYPCERCLEPADTPFELDILAVWVHASDSRVLRYEMQDVQDQETEVDGGLIAFEGDHIDLASVVWEETALAVPSKILCREDCAGLCPACGADLNVTTCSCVTARSATHPGLAKLAELFSDNNNVDENQEDSNSAGT